MYVQMLDIEKIENIENIENIKYIEKMGYFRYFRYFRISRYFPTLDKILVYSTPPLTPIGGCQFCACAQCLRD